MANFPHDLVFDILSRLPVKYIIRFKCVCKSWRSLIAEPQFVKTYLNRAISDGSVGCQRVLISNYKTIISLDYKALQQLSKKRLQKAQQKNGGNACTVLDDFQWSNQDDRVSLVGSCHGMVALVVDGDKIVLYNPCTREFRELPKPSSTNIKYRINGGLGYDSYVDDYKFVIAVCEDSDNKFKAEVFSLRNNSWRIIQDIPPDILYIYGFQTGVFLNGALHWIAICETSPQIISFDLATEKFQELLPLPPGQSEDLFSSDYRDLILLGGCLSVTAYNTEVWVMKKYGVEASWTKLFTVEINIYDAFYHYLRPVCFSENGELLVDVDNQIRIYNPKNQKSRRFCIGSWMLNPAVLYTESLVSPNGNVENNPHNITIMQ